MIGKNGLAVVGKIIKIDDIEGADRIKSATVVCGTSGKWIGVVQLDVYVGDIVTVFLQDAILPQEKRFKFMERSQYRVKISRFKGSPSECLIMKLGDEPADIGYDRTIELGVTKHEKPIPVGMQGLAKGNFPQFIPKTDEENFQRVPELVDRMAEGCVATLKYDGTSCTVYTDAEGGLHVCSRNLELKEFKDEETKQGSNAYWLAARKYGLERLPHGIALQMEVCGPGIQGNPAGFTELCAFAFKAYCYETHRYLNRYKFEGLCIELGMPMADLAFEPYASPNWTGDELRKLAASVVYPNDKPAEGIVISGRDGNWSFKVINPEYKG